MVPEVKRCRIEYLPAKIGASRTEFGENELKFSSIRMLRNSMLGIFGRMLEEGKRTGSSAARGGPLPRRTCAASTPILEGPGCK